MADRRDNIDLNSYSTGKKRRARRKGKGLCLLVVKAQKAAEGDIHCIVVGRAVYSDSSSCCGWVYIKRSRQD